MKAQSIIMKKLFLILISILLLTSLVSAQIGVREVISQPQKVAPGEKITLSIILENIGDKDIKNINTTDANLLEKRVLERELFIVDWEWMKQFQPYTQTGKTIISEWDNTIRFPKHSKLPNVIKTYNVKKGKIHLTKKIPEKIFEINFSKNSL